jgi:hypothetical protein
MAKRLSRGMVHATRKDGAPSFVVAQEKSKASDRACCERSQRECPTYRVNRHRQPPEK